MSHDLNCGPQVMEATASPTATPPLFNRDWVGIQCRVTRAARPVANLINILRL